MINRRNVRRALGHDAAMSTLFELHLTAAADDEAKPHYPFEAELWQRRYCGLMGKSCDLALGCQSTTNSSEDNLCGRRVSCSMEC